MRREAAPEDCPSARFRTLAINACTRWRKSSLRFLFFSNRALSPFRSDIRPPRPTLALQQPAAVQSANIARCVPRETLKAGDQILFGKYTSQEVRLDRQD